MIPIKLSILPALLCLVLSVPSLQGKPCNCSRDANNGEAWVEPALEESLAVKPAERVLVVMREPGNRTKLWNTRVRQDMVRGNQDAVLAGVRHGQYKGKFKRKLDLPDDVEFMVHHRYKLVNSLSGWLTADGLEKLRRHPLVSEIVLDGNMRPSLAESVPMIGADLVHRQRTNGQTVTGKNVVIFVVDTGVDYTHPDFGGCTKAQIDSGNCPRVKAGYDVYDDDDDPMDYYSHGTHIAGIVAANGGVMGVAPDAVIVPVKICSDDASACSFSAMQAGIDWVLAHKDSVGGDVYAIAMSIDAYTVYNYPNCATWMDGSLQAAWDASIIYASSSGNNGSTVGIKYPSCSPYTIAVGNVYKNDDIRSSSNRSPALDIYAPGTYIYSTDLNHGYSYKTGTSMAGPHVSASAALLMEYYYLATETYLPADTVKKLLTSSPILIHDTTALDTTGADLVRPRLDVWDALNRIEGFNQYQVTIADASPGVDTVIFYTVRPETFCVTISDSDDQAHRVEWFLDSTLVYEGDDETLFVYTPPGTLAHGFYDFTCIVDDAITADTATWVIRAAYEHLSINTVFSDTLVSVDSVCLISGIVITDAPDTVRNMEIAVLAGDIRLLIDSTSGLLDPAGTIPAMTGPDGRFSFMYTNSTEDSVDMMLACTYNTVPDTVRRSILFYDASSCASCARATQLAAIPGIEIRLGADLQFFDGDCIIINADSVTIDGRGHTIVSDGDRDGIVIRGHGASVKNINFHWTDNAIFLDSTTGACIESCSFDSSAIHVFIRESNNNTLRHNVFYELDIWDGEEALVVGLYGYAGSDSNDITENIFFTDGLSWEDVVYLEAGNQHNRIWRNVFYGDYGILDMDTANRYCVAGEGNFYRAGIRPMDTTDWMGGIPDNDCGPACFRSPDSTAGTIGTDWLVQWKPQSALSPVTYLLEASSDSGATWDTLAVTSDTVYQWDTRSYPEGTGRLLRITASDTSFSARPETSVYFGIDLSVPVELASFSATVSGRDVVLGWRTASEQQNLGFNILRRVPGGPLRQVNPELLSGAGTAAAGASYEFFDTGVPVGIYEYLLQSISFFGTYEVLGVLSVQVSSTSGVSSSGGAQDGISILVRRNRVLVRVPGQRFAAAVHNLDGTVIAEKQAGGRAILVLPREAGVYVVTVVCNDGTELRRRVLVTE